MQDHVSDFSPSLCTYSYYVARPRATSRSIAHREEQLQKERYYCLGTACTILFWLYRRVKSGISPYLISPFSAPTPLPWLLLLLLLCCCCSATATMSPPNKIVLDTCADEPGAAVTSIPGFTFHSFTISTVSLSFSFHGGSLSARSSSVLFKSLFSFSFSFSLRPLRAIV